MKYAYDEFDPKYTLWCILNWSNHFHPNTTLATMGVHALEPSNKSSRKHIGLTGDPAGNTTFALSPPTHSQVAN